MFPKGLPMFTLVPPPDGVDLRLENPYGLKVVAEWVAAILLHMTDARAPVDVEKIPTDPLYEIMQSRLNHAHEAANFGLPYLARFLCDVVDMDISDPTAIGQFMLPGDRKLIADALEQYAAWHTEAVRHSRFYGKNKVTEMPVDLARVRRFASKT